MVIVLSPQSQSSTSIRTSYNRTFFVAPHSIMVGDAVRDKLFKSNLFSRLTRLRGAERGRRDFFANVSIRA